MEGPASAWERGYRKPASAGIPSAGVLSGGALDQASGVDAEAVHSRPYLGPFLLEEARPLGIAQPRTGARGDEHADSALDDNQPFILESLVGLGDGQRVRLFLRGERADRRQRVAVAIFPGEDGVGYRLAQPHVNGLVVLGAKRHAVIIQRCA